MAKLIFGGSVPKDSPLFKGGWIMGGKRLTDFPTKSEREAAKKIAEAETREEATVEAEEDE